MSWSSQSPPLASLSYKSRKSASRFHPGQPPAAYSGSPGGFLSPEWGSWTGCSHCPKIKPLIVKRCKVIKSPAHFKGVPFPKSPKCFLSFIPPHPPITGKARVIVMKIVAEVSASSYHSILSLYVVHRSPLKAPLPLYAGWLFLWVLICCWLLRWDRLGPLL